MDNYTTVAYCPYLAKEKNRYFKKETKKPGMVTEATVFFSSVFFHHLRIPMSQVHRQWGVTAPISTDLPSEHEIKLTEDLVKTLHKYGLFESEQEAQNR